MDLLFATVDNVGLLDGNQVDSYHTIRPNLYNDLIMDHMDDKMKRSYNGFRNAEMIIDSILTNDDLSKTNRIKKKLDNF